MTSRPYQNIQYRFDSETIRLAGEEESESIKQEIDLVIKHRVPQVASRLKLGTEVQDLLQNRLLDADNRTYLWLHLILEDILERGTRKNTLQKMERFLKELPKSIYEAYEHMLKASPEPETARRLLHIILAAVRPLTLRELNMALNIEEGQQSREEVALDPEDDFATNIREVCGLFVNVNRADSTVYLLHQTAKEFLVSRRHAPRGSNDQGPFHNAWQHSMNPEDSNLVLTQICFRYLSFSAFEAEPCGDILDSKYPVDITDYARETREKFRAYMNKHDLLDYASSNWNVHFRMTKRSSELVKNWRRVCHVETSSFYTWFHIYCESKIIYYFELSHVQPGQGWQRKFGYYDLMLTPLILASMFGHSSVVEQLAEKRDLELKDILCRTALWWASKNDHVGVARQLLEKGASVQTRDSDGMTPLHNVAEFGHVEMMEILIENGASIDALNNCRQTPLILGVMGNPPEESPSKANLLLLKGADIHRHDGSDSGGTALDQAAQHNRFDVARFLIEKGAMDDQYYEGWDGLLDSAISFGDMSFFKLVIDKALDRNPDYRPSGLPLLTASAYGSHAIVEC